MPFLTDRRNLPLLIGGGLALVAGAAIATLLVSGDQGEPAPPPASQAGLVIDATGQDDGKLDPAKPLRCFVDGRFVGELALADCAQRNGVATGALDVGVDESGQLAAAGQAGTVLTPLPPPDAAAPSTPSGPVAAASPASGVSGGPTPAGACWRYAEGEWRRLPADLTLNGCVQSLFAGHCERPGGGAYGRWMQQTLRLVPGKVEVSGDNRSFRLLVEQAPGCAKRTLPPGEAGVCYHVVPQADGETLRYNRLVEKIPNLETCAANLEAMRIKFLRLGGSNRDVYGAYQGNFIFIQKEGVFTAPSLEEHRYLALVRTGDGRLAIPGAMPPGQ